MLILGYLFKQRTTIKPTIEKNKQSGIKPKLSYLAIYIYLYFIVLNKPTYLKSTKTLIKKMILKSIITYSI